MGEITILKILIKPHMIIKASILSLVMPRTFVTKNLLLFKFIGSFIEERVNRNVSSNQSL